MISIQGDFTVTILGEIWQAAVDFSLCKVTEPTPDPDPDPDPDPGFSLGVDGSYWSLGEAAGVRADSNGLRDMAPATNSPANAAGKSGNALLADGANYLRATGIDVINLQANGATVWGWIYPTNIGTMGILQNSTNLNMALVYRGEFNQLTFRVNDSVSGASTATNPVTLPLNAWHFVWGRYDPVSKQAEVGYNDIPGTIGTPLATGANVLGGLEIGRYGATIADNCLFDEVGLVLRKLTDQEIAYLYNGGDGNFYPF